MFSILVIVGLFLGGSSMAAEGTPTAEPKGILKCEGWVKDDGGIRRKSAKFSFSKTEKTLFGKSKNYVEVDGLEYGSGGYLYNKTQVIIYAPDTCWVSFPGGKWGFSGCKFNGILDRVDGSFTFRKGDKTEGNGSIYFYSNVSSQLICKPVDVRF